MGVGGCGLNLSRLADLTPVKAWVAKDSLSQHALPQEGSCWRWYIKQGPVKGLKTHVSSDSRMMSYSEEKQIVLAAP